MRKKWLLVMICTAVLAFYLGMVINADHPADDLYHDIVNKINNSRVVNFQSGNVIRLFDAEMTTVKESWQLKRKGTYDVFSKYLHYQNMSRFEESLLIDEEADQTTSLTPATAGNVLSLPVKEVYFKNGMYFEQSRVTGQWRYEAKRAFDLIDLLPLNAELLNRYGSYYRAENRGPFVVFYVSVDPSYLTRTFPDILASDDQSFPIRFHEGTLKLLVYQDSLLPKRVYGLYLIENLETGDIYQYNTDTYFSENRNYRGRQEPAIPQRIQQHRLP